MAIVHYHIDPFVESVNNISNNLDAISNKASTEKEAIKLQQKIQLLEQKEIELLSKLGIQGNNLEEMLKEANRRIQKYNSITQFTLSGQELYNKFVGPYQSKELAEAQKLNEAFRKLVEQELKNGKSELPKKVAEQKGGEIYEAIMRVLNKENTGNKGIFYSMKGIKGLTNINQIDLVGFTREQRIRAKEILLKNSNSKNNKTKTPKKIEVIGGKDYITTNITWFEATEGKTGKEAEKKDNKNNNFIQKAQQRLLSGILSLISADGDYKMRFINAYNQVISKHSTAIFVGQNANEITGLLGEIQAMIYLDVIINGDISNMSKIEWIGGTLGDAKTKPHADILLTNLGKNYGIQVKNTTSTKDTKTYHFTTLNATNFLERLELYGLSPTTKEYLENMYAAYGFNVGVANQNGTWVKVDPSEVENSKFAPARMELEQMPEIAEEIFSAFAAELMYMSTNEFIDANADSANVLYMLGSSGIQVASKILAEKDKEVKDAKNGIIKRFNVTADFTKNSSYTIAEAYNGNKSAFKSNQSEHSVDYTLSQIKLTSSYVFSF